jgi:hypothetical protein
MGHDDKPAYRPPDEVAAEGLHEIGGYRGKRRLDGFKLIIRTYKTTIE